MSPIQVNPEFLDRVQVLCERVGYRYTLQMPDHIIMELRSVAMEARRILREGG